MLITKLMLPLDEVDRSLTKKLLLDFIGGLPTIITSNLTKDDVLHQMGGRFHSRLFAKENTILEMKGQDLRANGIENEND